MRRVRVLQGDITTLEVDAVVNAANEPLLGGGGVDGAIHAAAGPELLDACRRIALVRPGVRCPTGEARITPAFRLPARFVIHTVGPVWRGGAFREPELLAACYRSALQLASAERLSSIAFPAISCGVFRYPVYQASAVAVRVLESFLATDTIVRQVLLVAYEREVEGVLRLALDAALKSRRRED